jgi:hypothetical protein
MDENETNKLAALDLAGKIYKVVTDKRFVEVAPDPEVRHNILLKKYPNFAQAYPIILRYISRDLRYNAKAFRKFLNKLEKDPGKGMEGFIERQSDYAKFLYIEDHKARGKHVNYKKAQELYNLEYQNMMKWLKKIKKEERDAKNEFEDESKENLQKKRLELLNFINSESTPSNISSMDDDIGRLMYGLPLKNAELTFSERINQNVNIEKLSHVELIELNSELDKFIYEKNMIAHRLKNVETPPDEYVFKDFTKFDIAELTTEYQLALKSLSECDLLIDQLKRDKAAFDAAQPPIIKMPVVEKYNEADDWLKDTLIKRRK